MLGLKTVNYFLMEKLHHRCLISFKYVSPLDLFFDFSTMFLARSSDSLFESANECFDRNVGYVTPANIYLFEVSNRNTREKWSMFKVNNKNTTPKRRQYNL